MESFPQVGDVLKKISILCFMRKVALESDKSLKPDDYTFDMEIRFFSSHGFRGNVSSSEFVTVLTNRIAGAQYIFSVDFSQNNISAGNIGRMAF